jgi:hypothetical protein
VKSVGGDIYVGLGDIINEGKSTLFVFKFFNF